MKKHISEETKQAKKAVADALAKHLEVLIRRGTSADVASALAQIEQRTVAIVGERVAQLDGVGATNEQMGAMTKKALSRRADGYRVSKAPSVPCSYCGTKMSLDPHRANIRACRGVAVPTVKCSACSQAWSKAVLERAWPATVAEYVARRRSALRRAAHERRVLVAHLHDRILPLARALVANVVDPRASRPSARAMLTVSERGRLISIVAKLGFRKAPKALGVNRVTLEAAMGGISLAIETRNRLIASIAAAKTEMEAA